MVDEHDRPCPLRVPLGERPDVQEDARSGVVTLRPVRREQVARHERRFSAPALLRRARIVGGVDGLARELRDLLLGVAEPLVEGPRPLELARPARQLGVDRLLGEVDHGLV